MRIEDISKTKNVSKLCASAIEDYPDANILLRDGRILPRTSRHSEGDAIDEKRIVKGSFGGCSNISKMLVMKKYGEHGSWDVPQKCDKTDIF